MGRQRNFVGFGAVARAGVLAFGSLALAHCSWPGSDKYSPKVVEDGEPVPKGGGVYRVGRPYSINGRTYVPAEDPKYRIEGIASWYGPDFHGRLTANGEVYDMHSISAAHTTMPLPSYARVTNLDNGKSIIVRVNDRGPYRRDRLIDLSIGTAKVLDFYRRGLARVRVEYVGRAPIEGSDDRMLMATLRDGAPAPAPSKVMLASAKPFIADLREDAPPPSDRRLASADPTLPFPSAAAETSPSNPSKPMAKPLSISGSPPRMAASAANAPSQPRFTLTRGDREALGLMSGRGLY
jgi:peptidoglycan lytic transglycosylase